MHVPDDEEQSSGSEDADLTDDDHSVPKTPRKNLSCRDEIELIKQIQAERIWELGYKEKVEAWAKISLLLHYPKATLQGHFKKLEMAFRKQTAASLRSSGTEEEYEEREILMTDIVSQLDDYKLLSSKPQQVNKKKVSKKKDQGKRLQKEKLKSGLELRAVAAITMKERTSNEPTSDHVNSPRQEPTLTSPKNGIKAGTKRSCLLDILESIRSGDDKMLERKMDLKGKKLKLMAEKQEKELERRSEQQKMQFALFQA